MNELELLIKNNYAERKPIMKQSQNSRNPDYTRLTVSVGYAINHTSSVWREVCSLKTSSYFQVLVTVINKSQKPAQKTYSFFYLLICLFSICSDSN